MDKIYYSPRGYWKGYSAISKLAKAAKVSEREARDWLDKQPVWRVYLPPPRYVPRVSFDISVPNEAHQADLLFLPRDKGYKYALTVIDVASRYKAARPLKSKRAEEVAAAFEDIYSKTALQFPKTLMVDPGREFEGRVKALFKSRGTQIDTGRVDVHEDQALVERFNKTLAERLFAHQYRRELLVGGRNREWVDRLLAVVEALNSETTRLTGLKPAEAIRLRRVKSKPSTPYRRPVGKDERLLPLGTPVRYLYGPGQAESDKRQRATDPIWSLSVREIERILVKPEQPALYYVTDGKRGYVREELQVV